MPNNKKAKFKIKIKWKSARHNESTHHIIRKEQDIMKQQLDRNEPNESNMINYNTVKADLSYSWRSIGYYYFVN